MCCSAASWLRGIHLAERDFILTCILAIFHSEAEHGREGLLNLSTAVWVTDGVLIYL